MINGDIEARHGRQSVNDQQGIVRFELPLSEAFILQNDESEE